MYLWHIVLVWQYVRYISTDKMSELTEEKPAAYIRRRAFNKVHVKSWLIYLEKDGFVRCSFKNCNFMAFNVEEMRNHYGYCKGVSYQIEIVIYQSGDVRLHFLMSIGLSRGSQKQVF